jgi:nucleotide-binding universal stress UspA family protein
LRSLADRGGTDPLDGCAVGGAQATAEFMRSSLAGPTGAALTWIKGRRLAAHYPSKNRRKTMYQRILIATDGSRLSAKAAQTGQQLAELTGAQLFFLNVVPRYPVSYFEGGASVSAVEVGQIEKQWADKAQTLVDQLKLKAEARGLKAKALTVKSDLVAEAVIASAKKNKCDLIVMASHGRRGLKRLLLGSETSNVLTHSSVPVLVLR